MSTLNTIYIFFYGGHPRTSFRYSYQPTCAWNLFGCITVNTIFFFYGGHPQTSFRYLIAAHTCLKPLRLRAKDQGASMLQNSPYTQQDIQLHQ
jgi:hypothetical protein